MTLDKKEPWDMTFHKEDSETSLPGTILLLILALDDRRVDELEVDVQGPGLRAKVLVIAQFAVEAAIGTVVAS